MPKKKRRKRNEDVVKRCEKVASLLKTLKHKSPFEREVERANTKENREIILKQDKESLGGNKGGQEVMPDVKMVEFQEGFYFESEGQPNPIESLSTQEDEEDTSLNKTCLTPS